MGDLLSVGRDGTCPDRHGGSKALGQQWTDPDGAIASLDEVFAGERGLGHQVDDKAFDLGSHGLQQIENERIPTGRVEVEPPEAGIETYSETSESDFDGSDAVEVVEDNVRRSFCLPVGVPPGQK